MAPTGEPPRAGLRALVGAGASQVPVSAALRARDAARPTAADDAAAQVWAAALQPGQIDAAAPGATSRDAPGAGNRNGERSPARRRKAQPRRARS